MHCVLKNHATRLAAAAGAVWLLLAAFAPSAQAQTYTFTKLHTFTSTHEGGNTYGSLVMDSQGNLYGVNYYGGDRGSGTVFKLDPSGNLTVLYSFCYYDLNCAPNDFRFPNGVMMDDRSGYLYGTASVGGYGYGGVFRVKADASGGYSKRYIFTTSGSDGCSPRAGVIMDASGILYGTTHGCGYQGDPVLGGTAFKLDPSTGTLTPLHTFAGGSTDGWRPMANLLMDASGSLYGTTIGGGLSNAGTVFKLSKQDTGYAFTLLHSFVSATDGASPQSNLIMDASGTLYGTAAEGGSSGGGTVFKLDSSGNNFTVLHHFASNDGTRPMAGLILDAGGNLYGTTYGGTTYGSGSDQLGTVFRLDTSGSNFTVLHRFTGADGANPYGGLIMDASGNLYGTTYKGGSSDGGGHGTVFKLTRLTFTGAPLWAFYGSQFTVSATPSANQTALISASGACFISGTTVTMTSGTGTCDLTADWLADSNYTAASLTQSTVAHPFPLNIVAEEKTKVLNAPNPAFTVTYSEFVAGDGPGSLDGTLSCTSDAGTTSPVGSYLITCSGQTSTNYRIQTRPRMLTILYAPAGSACAGDIGHSILQPINADGSSVWKQGATIPARFRVCDANGVSIGTPGVVAGFALTQILAGTAVQDVNATVTATNADTAFRWDSAGQQWIFNISTKSLAAGSTYVYSIKLNDGTAITFRFGLK